MKKINPNDPATGFGFSNEQSNQSTSGITIRAQIAAMAMQGLLANTNSYGVDNIISNSILMADTLIKKLNETAE